MVTGAEQLTIFTVDLLTLFAIYAIIVASLNLEFGYTGLPNFGKMLAIAGGAFIAGFVPGRIAFVLVKVDPGLEYCANNSRVMAAISGSLMVDPFLAIGLFLLTLVIAALAGGLLGFLASYPAIRLRADYLAITLLGMAEALRVIGYNYVPISCGTIGVGVADVFAWLTGPLSAYRSAVIAFVFLGIAALAILYSELLARSPLGRAMRAVRDNETAANSLGKDVVRMRMKVLVIGSGLAAIAGALFSFYTVSVFALTYDRVNWTFIPWVMVILGGAANNIGVTVGAFVFVAVRKLIVQFKHLLTPYVPFDVVWFDTMLVGVALMLFLLYRPQGLIPEKSTFTLSVDRLRGIIIRKTRQPVPRSAPASQDREAE